MILYYRSHQRVIPYCLLKEYFYKIKNKINLRKFREIFVNLRNNKENIYQQLTVKNK